MYSSMFHMFENEMLGVSIGSDYTILAFIFMPALPWTSLESNFKPQVANQFVVKMASQKKNNTTGQSCVYSPIHQGW